MVISTIVLGLVLGGSYALAALGLSLQYGVSRLMNLAFGEIIVLGAFCAMVMVTTAGIDPLLALIVLPPAGYLFGALLYQFVLQPVVRRAAGDQQQLEIDSILMTFGIMFMLQGAMVWIFGTGLSGYSYMQTPVSILGTTIAVGKLLALVLAVLIGGAVFGVMHFTRFGANMRAVGSSPRFAPFVGIDLNRYSRIAFAAGSAIAVTAGVLLSMQQPFTTTDGVNFTMKALIVVIMGGVGNLMGALVAGLALGLIESIVSVTLDPALTLASSFLLFIIVLLWRPQGIFSAAPRG